MENAAMQPVIMGKWRRPRSGWSPLMCTKNCNNRVVLFHCKIVTTLTHFNNGNSVKVRSQTPFLIYGWHFSLR